MHSYGLNVRATDYKLREWYLFNEPGIWQIRNNSQKIEARQTAAFNCKRVALEKFIPFLFVTTIFKGLVKFPMRRLFEVFQLWN